MCVPMSSMAFMLEMMPTVSVVVNLAYPARTNRRTRECCRDLQWFVGHIRQRHRAVRAGVYGAELGSAGRFGIAARGSRHLEYVGVAYPPAPGLRRADRARLGIAVARKVW